MQFEHRMNFEKERLEREKADLLQALIGEKIDALGHDPSVKEMAAAVNASCSEVDGDDGELQYELDENNKDL